MVFQFLAASRQRRLRMRSGRSFLSCSCVMLPCPGKLLHASAWPPLWNQGSWLRGTYPPVTRNRWRSRWERKQKHRRFETQFWQNLEHMYWNLIEKINLNKKSRGWHVISNRWRLDWVEIVGIWFLDGVSHTTSIFCRGNVFCTIRWEKIFWHYVTWISINSSKSFLNLRCGCKKS